MFVKSQRTWDRLSILVLTASIWIPAIRLRGTGWAPNLDLVEFLGLLGVLFGIWIGISSFTKYWAHLFYVGFSITIPFWLFVSRLEFTGDWLTRVEHLISRLGASITQILHGLPVQDSLVFIVFCSLAMWVLGYISAFGFTRNANPWGGLLPATVIYGLIDFYDNSGTGQGWVGAILVLCLMLMAARLHWLRSDSQWKKDGFIVERDAAESMLRITLISLVVLILLAWNIKGIIRSFSPGTEENVRVSQVWRQVQKQMENTFIALKPGTSLTGSYMEGMRLGSQAPTSQTPSFQVTSDSFNQSTPQMYWRVRTFDIYQDGMWISSPLTESGSGHLSKDFLKEGLPFAEYGLVITWNDADGSLVPYPGRISGMDIAFHLKYFAGDTELPGDGLVLPEKPLKNGDKIFIRSQVFTGTAQDLQRVSADIPNWMKKRYLQIPETLPSRVKELSTRIAVGETVFDRVEAVTDYLRNNFVYRGQISDVASGRDPVDWFLFDQKAGFCNYFASAEVLLLRSAGIPARLAVGYSQGESIPGGFQVRLNNGHAWPEVYFKDIGWIPFEPTTPLPATTYGRSAINGKDDLSLQLLQDERHPADGSGVSISGTKNSSNPNVNNQLLITKMNASFFFSFVLIVMSMYLYRTTRRNLIRISLPQQLVGWYEIRKTAAPPWLKTCAWYESLSDPARQYYRIEQLAFAAKIVDHSTLVPSELLDKLRMAFPDRMDVINRFQTGLYSEVYSREKLYDRENCKTAGAVLQKKLLEKLILKLLKIKFQ